MKYMGSKRRIAKDILPFILEHRKNNQWYIEPFCGGCNVIDKIDGLRWANDNNEYLIELFKALQSGWEPPKTLSEIEYNHIKNNKELYPKYLVGYVGIVLSYGSKWFGGYMRGCNNKGVERDYRLEGYNNVMKQVPYITDIKFTCMDYREINIPDDSIIYCDIPYEGVTKYKDDFNHKSFWDWARDMSVDNYIYISEYNAPDDFKCIWEKKICSSLDKDTGGKIGIEKLWVIDK
jgi:DNA adenine methylase